ncbi:AraC family transcriptional regulator [Arcobacteraceae bacterium]|nr:AraC family transcriptional regulator [Arcobacteraceae bacterium]
MDTIQYIKENLKEDSIISNDMTITKFCTVENNYKHTSYIQWNLLNIVYNGKKILHTVEGDITLEEGEAIFMTKGEYIMSEVIGDENYECLLIFFDHHVARQLIAELPFQLNSNPRYCSKNTLKFKVDSLISNAADNLKLYVDNKPKFNEELINLKLKELMLLILGSGAKNDFIHFCQNLIQNKSDLKSFMETNFEKNLTLNEFAKLSGRSLSGFKSEFNTIFKQTPMQWILKKRIDKGKFLIQELGYDVGTAALSVGFKTHAHFSRTYKKYYNCNPNSTDK